MQLESLGNPFTRDEKQALKQKREAQKQQIKLALEQQIAERQKAKEEERKKFGEGEPCRHKKIPSSDIASKRFSEGGEALEKFKERAVTPMGNLQGTIHGETAEKVPPENMAKTVKMEPVKPMPEPTKVEPEKLSPHQQQQQQPQPQPKEDGRWEVLKSQIEVTRLFV